MPSQTVTSLAVPRIRGTTDVLYAIADPVAQMKAPRSSTMPTPHTRSARLASP
jgi:hypothetical protein